MPQEIEVSPDQTILPTQVRFDNSAAYVVPLLEEIGANEPSSAAGEGGTIRAVNSEQDQSQDGIPGANRIVSLAHLKEQVRISESDLRRMRVPISRIQVDGDHLIVGGEQFRLEEDGLRSLCSEIGAPFNYLGQLGQLDRDLRNRNLEFGLRVSVQRASGLTDENSLIVVRDGRFRSLGRADLFSLPSPEVIDAVQEGLGRDLASFRVENFNLRGEYLALDLVSERIAAEVRRGDVLQAGIHLEHSLVGDTATMVTAYVLRLACMNGLTHRECLGTRKTKRTRRLPSDQTNAAELQRMQIKGLVEQTCRQLEPKLQAIRNLRDESFHTTSDVDKTFEQFLRRGRMFSQNLMRLLRRAWAEELGGNRELTYFGVLNALTWLATHSGRLTNEANRISDRQRIALANLAGIFAQQRVHICPACFSVVSGLAERTSTAE